MNNNLPKVKNPIHDLMEGNMPGLPSIIQNAMPVPLPRMNYNDNPLSMIYGNFKRTRLEKATFLEMQIARNSNEALKYKLSSIQEVVTYSSKLADILGQYEHNKDMRRLTVQHLTAEIQLVESKVQQTNYQTALIAQEVEAAKLDHQIKVKQLKEILDERTDVGGGNII